MEKVEELEVDKKVRIADFQVKTEHVMSLIREEKRNQCSQISYQAIYAGYDMVNSADGIQKEILEDVLWQMEAEIPLELPHVATWWYSVLLSIRKNAESFEKLIRYIRENKANFSETTLYFLFYQMMHKKFKLLDLDSEENTAQLWEFYIEIMEAFASKAGVPLTPIPKEERDDSLVLVLTEQFLDTWHGPTKTALDRCVTLMKKCKKRVLLINTGEVLSGVGAIPFCAMQEGNYDQEKISEDVQYWKGMAVSYLQCDKNMPNREDIDYLLLQVRHMAPGHVVFIGKGGVLGNLIGQMLPTLAVGLCPSALEFTTAKYQTLGRKLNMQDMELLKRVGYERDHVIESVFTSGLKVQTQFVTRTEVGLPEKAFIMCVIGTRLELEVTDSFLEMVEAALMPDMRVIFWGGGFYSYQKRIQRFPKLKEQSSYLGICDDILAGLELCDLYLNPTRRGGGTSCVEALSMGLPVVTVNFGDVAVNAGEEFCVKDYEEMKGKISQYHEDKAYYQRMSELAKERAAVLLDSDTEFVKVIQEMDRRENQLG